MDAYANALGLGAQPSGGGYTGKFVGSPDDVAMAIAKINDPTERAHAQQAFESQMRATGGKLPPPTPKPDPYADALGLGRAMGASAAPGSAPAATPQAPAKPAKPSMDVDVGATFGSPVGGPGAATSGIRANLASQVTSLGANIVGGYRGLATLLTGGTLDDAANNVRDYVDSHTYTPPKGTQAAQAVASFNSPQNPVNWPGIVADKAGERVTDATGSPALGAAVNTAINGGVLALVLRGKPGIPAPEIGPGRPATGIYKPVELPRGNQALPGPGEPSPVVPQAVPERPVPATAAPATTAAQPAPEAARAGAAAPAYQPFPAPTEVRAAPPVPSTPEAVQAVAEKAPTALFPETPTNAPQGKFGPEEQLARAKILQSVGIDPDQLRKSALAGDAIGGSTDFQTAKVDSPAGRTMRSILDNERQALINNADSLVKDTGGTHGVDQSALYARGNTIVAPLDSMKQWFDNKTSALYRAADEKAQGVPTQLNSFKDVLNDASQLTNSDRVHLQGAVNAYIKKLDMASEDGSVAGSAQQAETIRKYLNEQWSPQNSRYVGALKDALDEDVTKAAGEDVYSEARKVRALRGQTLDNPNGIAKLMDSSGPEGINRAVPVEKIPDALAGMPVDQFSHVVKTLREAPDEIQPQAQSALAEIKAHFANKVQAIGSAQQGQWNAKGVTKYLQNNAAKMAQIFTPEEIAKFRNLNDAGHIVAKDQSYPGAAVQGHNLVTSGVMHALPTAGAAAGSFVAGPVGGAVGAAAGKMLAGTIDNATTVRAVKKRTTKLSDLLGTGK